MSSGERMLVISLPGGDWRIFDRQIQDGVMPNLRRLRRDGVSGDLHGVVPTLTSPNWATLWTGQSPAAHGVFSRAAIGPDDRIIPYFRPADIRFQTWLDRAEALGRRTLSMYAPLTGPSQFSPNAVCVVGDPSGPLRERFGERPGPGYEQFFPTGGFQGPEDRREFVRAQTRSIQQIEEEALFLLGASPKDLAIVHVLPIDPLLHAVWHHADAGYPLWDGSLDKELGSFYRSLDGMIGRLIDAQGASTVLAFSDHGLTPCESVVSLSAALLASPEFEPCAGLGPEHIRLASGSEAVAFLDHKAVYVNRAVSGSERATKAILETLLVLEEPNSGKRPPARAATAEELFGPTLTDVWTVIILEPAPGFSSRVGAFRAPLFQACLPDRDFLVSTHNSIGLWALWGDGAGDEMEGSRQISDVAALVARRMRLS